MIQIVLVGLGAGAAAALLFASVVSGSLAAVFRFYLAPLPIMIAALGWSHIAGLIAAASATALVAALSGVFWIAVPVIAFGGWWLGYLAWLARPATNGGGGALEWYPVGRLVLWGAVIGTLIVAAAVPNFGTDQESLQAALRKTYERILRDQALIDVLVVAGPPAAAGVFPVTTLCHLLPALPGLLAGVFAASLLMAFAILGFAVVHAIRGGMRARIVMLAGLYAAAMVLGWPVLAMAVVGLAEAILNIRSRVARKRGPPSLRASCIQRSNTWRD